MIHFKNIHKSFGRQQVLKGIDVLIDKPGIYAVLGPNGSGKTTLIKSLMAMVRPSQGQIDFMNQPVQDDEYRRHIAYLPQIARFPENLTTSEFFDFIENIRGKASRKKELIEWFDLAEYLNENLRTLSGGTRQKINLVSALMYDTKVVVLDEPTIGLDPVALLKLKDWIRREQKQEKMILFTTHVMDIVEELADEIIFILEGKVYYRGDQETLFEQTSTSDVEHAIAHLLTLKKTNSHEKGI